MARRHIWTAVALSGVLLGAGAATTLRLRHRAAAGRAAPPVVTRCGPAGAPGERRTWPLQLHLGIERSRGSQPLVTTLRAQLEAATSGGADEGCAIAWKLRDARVSSSGIEQPPEAELRALERQLSMLFFVAYNQSGAAVRSYFPAGLDPSARNVLLILATEAQFVRPAAGTTGSWTARERDSAGLYLASYVQSQPGRFRKTKLRYLTSDGAAATGPVSLDVTVVASERTFVLDAAGGLASLSGKETISVGSPGLDAGTLGMTFAVELGAVRVAPAPELADSFSKARATLEAYDVATQRPDEKQELARRDRELVGSAALPELLEAVRAQPAAPRDTRRLTAWLRLHPDSVPAVLAEARARGSKAKPVLHAMAGSGTSSALQALCTLASDEQLPAAVRQDVLTAMYDVDQPSSDLLRCTTALVDSRDDVVRRAALLTAGTLVHAGRRTRSDDVAAVERALLERLTRATSPAARIEVIDALGNGGGPAVLGALEKALGDSSSAVRGAAVRALRLLDDARVDGMLAATMERDGDASVRRAAVFTAGFRKPEPLLAALLRAAEHDDADFVRSAAISQLGSHVASAPAIAPALQRIAEHDAKPGNRRLARELLERARK